MDAGKTTLSEGLLYLSGRIRKLGRVDHGNAFLDTFALERERGITIFSKQAFFSFENTEITLMDTPGHVDFSAEMERTLQILDYAILVVSGSDGVQGHTETLWKLLKRYRIPVFLFVNKMDLDGTDRTALMSELKSRLSTRCVDFGAEKDTAEEQIALCDERLLDQYLKQGSIPDTDAIRAIAERNVFPCYFGSALKLDGVEEFLAALARYTRTPVYPAPFGAKVYKISRDAQGNRLTHMKVTGGSLKVKAPLTNRRAAVPEEEIWEEKVDQIRIYSGAKYEAVSEAAAGTVCAVTGLSKTFPGGSLGFEVGSDAPVLEPVLTYRLGLPMEYNVYETYLKLKVLEEEDPQLHLVWNEHLKEIHIQLMGEVQMEVLQRLILDRFGVPVVFGNGSIAYKETIEAPVVGVGHYEPLRHYAEVHLLLEPGERGSGLVFDTICSEDDLDRNWQHLVLSHLAEKEHIGVLTGSPITDIKTTLIAGRAHVKHTEGGDFRQATYRAVRQALMQAKSVLLEPYYDFRLVLPGENIGRAMTDIRNRGGSFQPPETEGALSVLSGSAPVSAMRDYLGEVVAYTKGRGRLSLLPAGYDVCHNPQEVIDAIGYDADGDAENSGDSIFCSQGTGYFVKWNEVSGHQHLAVQRSDEAEQETPEEAKTVIRKSVIYSGSLEEDRLLQKIFERTYGPLKDRVFLEHANKRVENTETMLSEMEAGESYLLVDGYNIVFAWDELKALARDNLDLARQTLINRLSDYQAYRKNNIIVVFDAYKVTGGEERIEKSGGVYVVYTREAEIADVYIEKVVAKIGRYRHVRVATSDRMEQLIVLGKGAYRVPAGYFIEELTEIQNEISEVIRRNNQKEQY